MTPPAALPHPHLTWMTLLPTRVTHTRRRIFELKEFLRTRAVDVNGFSEKRELIEEIRLYPTQEVQQFSAYLGGGGANRGLSVSFLNDEFLSELKVQPDEVVYDTEPRLRAASKETAGGQIIKCPRDGLPGAAYVDVANDPNAGPADFMLSYTWGYKVHDIVRSLNAFCRREKRDPRHVRVWICALCINQHRVKEKLSRGEVVPFKEFAETFDNKVQSIGHVLALLTPWAKPLYVTRLWCIFEFVKATQSPKVCWTIVLPDEQEKDFEDTLMTNTQGRQERGLGGMTRIFEALGQVNVETADASQRSDKDNILRDLMPQGFDIYNAGALAEACVGYNRIVVHKLRDWFCNSISTKVKEKLRGEPGVSTTMALCGQLVQLFLLLGDSKRDEAAQLVDEAIRICKSQSLTETI